MAMKQQLNEFVSSVQEADIGRNELLNSDMVVAKHSLFLYTQQLTHKHLDIINEHMNANIFVTIVTTKKMSDEVKKRISRDFFIPKQNHTKSLKRFETIGYIITGIGFIFLALSLIYHFLSEPITRHNEVSRLILPLLEIYLGFIIADFAFKRQYQFIPMKSNISLNIYKNNRHTIEGDLYMTDRKRIIYQDIREDNLGISHVRIIENPNATDQLSAIIEKEIPLPKREGLSFIQLWFWLLD